MSGFYRDNYREYYQGAIRPDAAYAMRYHKEVRLAYTGRLIAEHARLNKGARILDIGCAEGTLFAVLSEQQESLRLVGIEPSDNFASYARRTTGCTTYPDLEALDAAGGEGFDTIIVNHVLEHVDDPVALLNRLAKMLTSDGRIFIDVPDADRYGTPEMLHIAHLFHFTPRTMAATLEKAGWHVLALERHAPPHHPPSVWCVAEPSTTSGTVRLTSPSSELVAWDAMRRLARALPLYLLRRRILRSRLVTSFAKLVRSAHAHGER